MSKDNKPQAEGASVTLVLISYNHENYVEQALDSAFAQTHPNCSVLIFDDASSDSSGQRIHDYLDRPGRTGRFIHHGQNQGLCATLNEALGLVTSDYVAFIAADDWMEPHRLEVQVAALEQLGSEYGAAYSDAALVDVAGQHLDGSFLGDRLDGNEPPQGNIFLDLLRGNWIPAPSVLIRREVFLSVGCYDESLPYEDYDMWLRIARHFKIAFTPGALVTYRKTPGSLTESIFGDHNVAQDAHAAIYRKHFGQSEAVDTIISSKFEHLAISQYLRGVSGGKIRSDLRLVARRTRRLAPAVYAAFATVRIPGPWIGLIRQRAKCVQHGA